MPIVRMIVKFVPPGMGSQAERDWKEKCTQLMSKQPGCLLERMLRSKDNPGEYISYAEWDSEESTRTYLKSVDQQQIKRHSTNFTGAKAVAKECDTVL